MASKGLAALTPSATTRFYNGKSQAKISASMARALDGLSKAFGGETIGIQSGYRSPSYNKGVGGAKSSYHTKGMAVDIDMSGWSTAKRQQAIETLSALGVGGFITYSKHPNMLHIDMRQTPNGVPHFMFDKTARLMDKAPAWFQDMAAKAKPVGLASALPDTMQAPLSLAETQLRDEAIAQAYASPTRALDVPQAPFSPPSRPLSMTPSVALNTLAPPSRLAPVSLGKVTRAPLDAIPASLNATPVGAVQRAPLGPVGQFSKPASPLAHPVSTAKPSALAAAPVGTVEKGPALAPAGPSTQATIDAYSQYGQSRQAAQEMAQAAQDAAYAGFEAQRANALSNLPAAPIAPAPPAVAPPAPAAVLAPALAPPKAIQDRPIAEMPSVPSAPKATAYDVYSGLANSAMDNTGQNTVGRLADGTTTVTNQYGVTTGMTPYGKQTAVGSLPGITGPVAKTAAKVGIPALGSLALGPVGGILGALAVGAMSKPGGLLGAPGMRTVDSVMGPISAFAVNPGLNQFPSAPSGGVGTTGFRSAADRSRAMSMSPKATADIDAGRGGLF